MTCRGNRLTVICRTVIECGSPVVLGWAIHDIGGSRSTAAGPPAVLSRLGEVLGGFSTGAISGDRDIGDVNTLNFLKPLLDLRTVSRGWLVGSRPLSWVEYNYLVAN